jgi:hypothetical protein
MFVVHCFLTTLFLIIPIFSQSLIDFDDQGWSPNQSLDSNFTINNFLYSSNKYFYTNYGYNFDVYSVGIFFVFQNPVEDQFTITTSDQKLFNLKSIAAYQVSELSDDNLIIEGWNGSSKEYSATFNNITTWQILSLNYNNINKTVFKLESSGQGGLTDFNFDNFYIEDSTIVAQDSTTAIPKSYNLSQNYPNPFNPSTAINYQLPQAGKVTIKIYDIIGNEVSILADGYIDAGSYSVTFNASNLASGIYLYELKSNEFVSRKKMMFIK